LEVELARIDDAELRGDGRLAVVEDLLDHWIG
jgi:hypothetical protein